MDGDVYVTGGFLQLCFTVTFFTSPLCFLVKDLTAAKKISITGSVKKNVLLLPFKFTRSKNEALILRPRGGIIRGGLFDDLQYLHI